MKKIITILLAFAMLFAFVACDPVTDSKNPINNNPSVDTNPPVENDPPVDNNSPDKDDPFENIEATLTVPVENLDDIDFTGTWDFERNMIDSAPEYGERKQTDKGYITVAEDKVTITCTYLYYVESLVSEEIYIEQKLFYQSILEEEPENYTQSTTFDDTQKTITIIGGKGALDEMNDVISLEEFIRRLSRSGAATFTTNEAKTAFKADFGDEGYYIYIKR